MTESDGSSTLGADTKDQYLKTKFEISVSRGVEKIIELETM